MTECSQTEFEFQGLFSREVIGRFDGGQITSDGGSLLLREVEGRTGILRRLAGCFTDHRALDRIAHSVEELIAQRIYALALGYEDLNDHEQLRADPLLAVLAGKRDPEGKDRKQERDRGKALAGKSTLNRWELTRADATEQERYAKIVMDPAAIDQLLVEAFLEAHATPPGGDGARSGCHRRSTLRQTGRTLLSRLLWPLLLFAVVHLRGRSSVVRTAAALEYRCLGGQPGRSRAHRPTDSCALARSADPAACRLRFLPGRSDELV